MNKEVRSMPANRQVLVCRAAFLLLCLLPTLVVCSFCWYSVRERRALESRQTQLQQLTQRLGLRLEVESVSTVGDQCFLHGVQILHQNHPDPVAYLRSLDVGQESGELRLAATQVEIDPTSLAILEDVARDWSRLRVLQGRLFRMTATEATIRGPNPRTLVDLKLTASGDQVRRTLAAEFRVAGDAMQGPAKVQVHHDLERQTTKWVLNTANAVWPCSLLSELRPAFRDLGAHSQFRGAVTVFQGPQGSWVELAGEFLDLELERLLEPFSHRVTGLADVVFHRVRLVNGRWTEAAGLVRSPGGLVSTPFVDAVGREFGLQSRLAPPQQAEPLLRYSEFALGFELSRGSLLVTGLCDHPERGVVLQTHGQAVLAGTSTTPPAVSLVRALSPNNEYLVPATAQADVLLGILPLPKNTAPERLGAAPSARLRLAPGPASSPLRR